MYSAHTHQKHGPPAALIVGAALVLAFLAPLSAVAAPASFYFKQFYANKVKEKAAIDAGGMLQTWGGEQEGILATSGHEIKKGVVTQYIHAPNLILRKGINTNEGFPIANTGKTVDDGDADNGAYNTGLLKIDDEHVESNHADGSIKVGKRVVGMLPNTIRVRLQGGGEQEFTLTDAVLTQMLGRAQPGTPVPLKDIKKDVIHSADSFVAAELTAEKVFVRGGIDQPAFDELMGKSTMIGGALNTIGQKLNGENLDPYFVTVTDLDTDTVTTEMVMSLDLAWSGALFSLDDLGIRLTINRHDPDSFVTLVFNSMSSTWVLNPYMYGARLDNSGLTAFGLTPQSDWNVTTTANTIEAFFPFGPEGQPFDYAMVRPPDNLFVDGHTYTYDSGASDGAYEIVAVPEPCDVNGDGKVDISDINAIFAARDTPATPGDPRDADGDGIITVNDARICVNLCKNPRCAP